MISPEYLHYVPETLPYVTLAVGVLGMAFTSLQKRAIHERDGNKCQATVEHQCNQEKGTEIDHILPQRYCYSIGVDPDFPENALSKCKNAHDIKHPDRVPCRQLYHQAKHRGIDTFKELQEKRNNQVKNHVIYWNPDNDRTDYARALQLTQAAKRKGWSFPPKHIN